MHTDPTPPAPGQDTVDSGGEQTFAGYHRRLVEFRLAHTCIGEKCCWLSRPLAESQAQPSLCPRHEMACASRSVTPCVRIVVARLDLLIRPGRALHVGGEQCVFAQADELATFPLVSVTDEDRFLLIRHRCLSFFSMLRFLCPPSRYGR
jgi:hypothetical protein